MTTRESGPPAEGNYAEGPATTRGRVHLEHSRGSRQVPVARGRAYIPTGRRTQYIALVDDCPHCHAAHIHRGRRWYDLAAVIKTGSCGRSYELHLSGLQIAGEAA